MFPCASLSYQQTDSFMAGTWHQRLFGRGGTPLEFGSVTTKNYEVVARIEPISSALSVDAVAYLTGMGCHPARLFVPVTFEAPH